MADGILKLSPCPDDPDAVDVETPPPSMVLVCHFLKCDLSLRWRDGVLNGS
jgi:hypothetical protein